MSIISVKNKKLKISFNTSFNMFFFKYIFSISFNSLNLINDKAVLLFLFSCTKAIINCAFILKQNVSYVYNLIIKNAITIEKLIPLVHQTPLTLPHSLPPLNSDIMMNLRKSSRETFGSSKMLKGLVII